MPDSVEQPGAASPALAQSPAASSQARGVGRDMLLYAVSTVVSALCSFVGVYLFTRLLPPSEMGHYALVMATVEILTNFGFGWINMTLLREYPAQSLAERPHFLGRIIAAQIMVSLVVSVAVGSYCLLSPFSQVSAANAASVLVLIVFQATLSFNQWVFRVQRRASDWALSSMLVAVTKLGMGWLLLTNWQASGSVLVISQGAATLLSALVSVGRWRGKVVLDKSSFKLANIRPILSYGLPLTLVGAAQNLLNRAGLLVLSIFRSRAEIGIYYQAYQLTLNLLQLPYQPLDLASSPTSYHVLEREGPVAAARYMYHFTALVLQVLSAVGLSIYLLREAVVAAVLDPAYADAADLMVYLLPTVTLVYLQSQLRRGFEFGRATGQLSWYISAALVFNVALNFILAPPLGGSGIALASLLTYALYGCALYIGGSRHVHFPLPWLPAFTLIVPTAALLGLDCLLPTPGGLAATVVQGIAYSVFYLLLSMGALRLAGREGLAQTEFVANLLRRRARQAA